jgi:signal peptidase I
MKILSSLLTIILSLILLLMVFVVISSKAKGGEPSVFGYQLKTVLSGSMEPTFKTGSIIAIEPLQNTNDLKKGDIITFHLDKDNLATHRIIELIHSGNQVIYKTKGDNNKNADQTPVVSQNVVAKYSGFTVPYMGYLIEFTKSKKGAVLLLVLPGLLLLAYSGFTVFRALKEVDKTKKNDDAQQII